MLYYFKSLASQHSTISLASGNTFRFYSLMSSEEILGLTLSRCLHVFFSIEFGPVVHTLLVLINIEENIVICILICMWVRFFVTLLNRFFFFLSARFWFQFSSRNFILFPKAMVKKITAVDNYSICLEWYNVICGHIC